MTKTALQLLISLLGGIFHQVLLAQQYPLPQEQLPNVREEFLSASFWRSKIEAPDRPIWSATQLAAFNRKVGRRGYLNSPLKTGVSLKGSLVKKKLEGNLAWLRRYYKYDEQGRRVRDPSFSIVFRKQMAVEEIPKKIRLRHAISVVPTAMRALPTSKPLFRRPHKRMIDLLQTSRLTLGSFVVVYHTSLDRQWVYVENSFTGGWVKESALAFASLKELQALSKAPREMVIEARLPVYRSADRDELAVEVSNLVMANSVFSQSDALASLPSFSSSLDASKAVAMQPPLKTPSTPREKLGGRALYALASPSQLGGQQKRKTVFLPLRKISGRLGFKAVYVPADGLTAKPLPFTPHNVLTQAFKLLRAPFSWGGKEQGWDCSSFLKAVFTTMGLTFPRSSVLQAASLKQQEKQSAAHLDQATPLQSLFYISSPNHIMLYLGEVEGRPYVIHSTLSYEDENGGVGVVGRVVVSDLSLGAGGKQGSLQRRIEKIAFF